MVSGLISMASGPDGDDGLELFIARVGKKTLHALVQRGLLVAPFVT